MFYISLHSILCGIVRILCEVNSAYTQIKVLSVSFHHINVFDSFCSVKLVFLLAHVFLLFFFVLMSLVVRLIQKIKIFYYDLYCMENPLNK